MAKQPLGILCRVAELDGVGAFIPDGPIARNECRDRKFRVGQKVLVSFHKLRNWGTDKHAHNIGKLLRNNLDAFSGYHNNHDVLKFLQIEGNIACDQIGGTDKDGNDIIYKIPRSLRHEEMDEDEILQVINKMYQFVSERYWPEMTPEAVQEMAEMFGDEH